MSEPLDTPCRSVTRGGSNDVITELRQQLEQARRAKNVLLQEQRDSARADAKREWQANQKQSDLRATIAALQQRCAIMREFIANCGIGEVRFLDGSVMTQAAALAPDGGSGATTWLCGCGATNGVNLAECGACRRPRGEGEVQRATDGQGEAQP